MAVGTSGNEISSIIKKDFPKKTNKILRIINIYHKFYGYFGLNKRYTFYKHPSKFIISYR